MNEYRVKVTVRNNLLLSAIEAAGYTSQSSFAEAAGIANTALNALVGLRAAPISYHHGTFTEVATAVMECLGACPTDLWTDAQLTMRLERNSSERTVCESDVQFILENHIDAMMLPSPEDTISDSERKTVVSKALDCLTPREARMIRMRYGMVDELTLREAGELENISVERARQIEQKALRKMRNPKISGDLKIFV